MCLLSNSPGCVRFLPPPCFVQLSATIVRQSLSQQFKSCMLLGTTKIQRTLIKKHTSILVFEDCFTIIVIKIFLFNVIKVHYNKVCFLKLCFLKLCFLKHRQNASLYLWVFVEKDEKNHFPPQKSTFLGKDKATLFSPRHKEMNQKHILHYCIQKGRM